MGIITNDMEASPDDAERPSKTELKRQMHALQTLGEQLVELSHDQFARLDLPDELREAVEFAHRVKGHEARRRHMQYLGKLMRRADAEAIRAARRERELQQPPKHARELYRRLHLHLESRIQDDSRDSAVQVDER